MKFRKNNVVLLTIELQMKKCAYSWPVKAALVVKKALQNGEVKNYSRGMVYFVGLCGVRFFFSIKSIGLFFFWMD